MIEAPKNGNNVIDGDVAAQVATEGAKQRKKRSGSGRPSTVGGDGAGGITWNHDAGRWGTPRQEWKQYQKIAWLLYVIQEATGQQQQVGTGQLANAFNTNFSSAGVVHQGNMARDLASQPDLFGELRRKWFLKDKGRQLVTERLLPEALGQVVPAVE